MVDAVRNVIFNPVDEALVSNLPFAALGYFDAIARNVTGLSTPHRAPVRAFELWGRTAKSSTNSVHIANCAVVVLAHSVPSIVVRRPLAIATAESTAETASVSDLTISSNDEQFAFDLLKAPLTRLLQEMPRGASFAVQGCFAMLQVPGDHAGGLRALAERCETFVEAIPELAMTRFPLAISIDPLAA